MPRYAAVYRHYDASGDLLYIGCSINPFMRLHAHQWGASWAMDIHRVEIEWFPCEDAAYRAEGRAIEAERPRHNKLPRKANAVLAPTKER